MLFQALSESVGAIFAAARMAVCNLLSVAAEPRTFKVNKKGWKRQRDIYLNEWRREKFLTFLVFQKSAILSFSKTRQVAFSSLSTLRCLYGDPEGDQVAWPAHIYKFSNREFIQQINKHRYNYHREMQTSGSTVDLAGKSAAFHIGKKSRNVNRRPSPPHSPKFHQKQTTLIYSTQGDVVRSLKDASLRSSLHSKSTAKRPCQGVFGEKPVAPNELFSSIFSGWILTLDWFDCVIRRTRQNQEAIAFVFSRKSQFCGRYWRQVSSTATNQLVIASTTNCQPKMMMPPRWDVWSL
jgi:hypothetical protein